MRKALGLLGLLAGLIALSCLWEFLKNGQINFLSHANMRNVLTWIGLFGILSVAQSLVIIAGGIDLSVGSVVALSGIATAMALDRGNGMHPAAAIPLVLSASAVIGLWHGLLVAKARIQPFIVTLCGLFFYRGVARVLTDDASVGFGPAHTGLRRLGNGFLPTAEGLLPVPFVLFAVIAGALGVYLHLTAPGRHLYAVGANEESARFSGLRTDRIKILAYVLCSVLTGLGGILIAFKVSSLGPSNFGSFYELYAIAGAVLGGCSLRGGSGTVLGVVIGASLIVVLQNLVNILEIPSQLEYVVIGAAILAGVCTDELIARRGSRAPTD